MNEHQTEEPRGLDCPLPRPSPTVTSAPTWLMGLLAVMILSAMSLMVLIALMATSHTP